MADVLIEDRAPDLILTGGRITTLDPDLPEAEAIAIKDGKILAVGTSKAIEELAGSATTVIRLEGQRVIPGINDTHNHLLSTGAVINQVSLYDARSVRDIQERVATAAKTAPPGGWILGRGWDESLLAEKRFPTRWDLDEVAPNNPVVLDRVWNMLLTNSAAMAAADIGRTTPDPPADGLYAGRIVRDEQGEPTGVFRDRAKRLIQDAVPVKTTEQMEHEIRSACAAYNALGITSAADPGLTPDKTLAYQNVYAAGDLSVRTSMCLAGWGFAPEEDDLLQRFADVGLFTGFGDDMLRLDTIKFMPDGGMGDRTALMYEPYLDEPDNCGQFVVTEDDLRRHIRWVHDRGWSIDCHTCGDRMQDIVIDAYANAQRENPNPRIRHRVHHAYFPTPKSLELMREFRFPALATIPFVTNLGESYVSSVGQERAAKTMPLRTYLDAGVPLALSSDSPVTTYNPFIGIYAATTRKTVTGRVLGADQCISREEALRLYTTTAAWVTFEDDIKGALSPGKLADLAVLDQDLFDVDDEQLKQLKSVLTLVGGRIVHDDLGVDQH